MAPEAYVDDTVRYEYSEDHVATITLNRGEKLKDVDREMIAVIAEPWERLKHEKVHAVVSWKPVVRAVNRACAGGAFHVVDGQRAEGGRPPAVHDPLRQGAPT